MAPLLDKSVVSTIFIGRAPQLATFDPWLAQGNQGRSQVVLVAGEAGIGKSRLATEVRQRAERQGWQTVQGRCFEPDRLFPYAPLIDLLRTCLARHPLSEVTTLLGPLAAEVVKLLPELAPALHDLHPTPRLDPEATKRRLFAMLTHFFTQLPAPLLLIIEDLHWSDETSLEFLRYLAHRTATHPLLLLLTYRSDEIHPTLHHFLAALDREQRPVELALPRFTPAEVDALLRAILALGRPVRTEFLDALCRLTDGNPFFIEEVLKALIATGDVFYSDGVWDRKPMNDLQIPRTVQDAVQRRVVQLSAAARYTLTVAAVAGQHFDFAVLQAVTGYTEGELLTQIKELLAAQLVVEASAERFAFRHALTRQAVCSQLLAREQKAFHRRIAEALEQLYAPSLESYAADLAYHFYEADAWEKVLDYARRAGEQARALYTPHAAIEQFTRALEAAHHLDQTAALPDLYRVRGLAYGLVGAFEQARADHETVLHLARTTGNSQLEWRALLNLGQLWAARDYTQTGDYYQQALAIARTLVDASTLARSLNRVGNWHLNHGEEPQKALSYHQEALPIFQALQNRRGLAQTLDLLGMTHLLSGNVQQGALHLKEAIALFQQLDGRQGLSSSLATLSLAGMNRLHDVGRAAAVTLLECRRWNEQAVQVAQEIGWRAGEAYALGIAAYPLSALGQYGAALAQTHRGLAIAEEIGHRQWICLTQYCLGILYSDLLALPLARRYLEQALALANELGSLFHARLTAGYLIALLLEQDELGAAEALLNRVAPPDLPMKTAGQRWLWRGRAELAVRQGNFTHALSIIDQLIARNRPETEPAGSAITQEAIGSMPHLAQLRAEGLLGIGQWGEAESTLTAAQRTVRAYGTPRLLWRIHLALGKLYQAQRRSVEARQAFADARQVIDAIAATVPDPELRNNFVRQANAMMSQPQPTTSPLPMRQTYHGLTRREREVAVLIAQGKSNRAIAEALVIGERTVEGYVSNILNKLGFTSRVQIAAWVVEKGL
ncbi:MAG: helix-turn-helix transcriptional regulator [Caldilinea sp. CFX5]|nr:helix-turn-helix transcriptional regulator [Caldilinea sp. CFX5]